jgi:drug/metabolite transporter (DMT)-like permease
MFNRDDIKSYFNAEKQAGLAFLVLGAAVFLLSLVYIFYLDDRFYKGASIPLFVLGLIITVIGFTIFKRSDTDLERNIKAFEHKPRELRERELPRMEKVLRNFIVLRYIETFLFLLGVGLYIYFLRDFENDFWRGFGMALAIMSLMALAADYFAEKRARKYYEGLKEWLGKV